MIEKFITIKNFRIVMIQKLKQTVYNERPSTPEDMGNRIVLYN